MLRRLVESEGVVGRGAALVEIGDPARIEVVADFLSREAAQVKPGDAVNITRWGGETALPGRVRRVEPFGQLKISALGIEEQRMNIVIDFAPAAAPQIARLGHGYQVDATVMLWQAPEVLRVPVGALFRGGDGAWQVFVEDDGRAHLRDIMVGHLNEDSAEVLEGLKPGQRVVLNPSGNIQDGTRITPRD